MNRLFSLCLLVMVAMPSVASDLKSYRLSQTVGKQQYESTFGAEAVSRNVQWTEGNPLPLTIEKAVSVARDEIVRAKLGSAWSLTSAQLMKVEGSELWLYELTFARRRIVEAGYDQLIVPVSLAGDAATLTALGVNQSPAKP